MQLHTKETASRELEVARYIATAESHCTQDWLWRSTDHQQPAQGFAAFDPHPETSVALRGNNNASHNLNIPISLVTPV